MWPAALVLTPLVLELGPMLMSALAQTRLPFPAHLGNADGPALPASAVRRSIDTPDGKRLAGIRVGLRDGRMDAGLGLLGFGDSAWNADVMALHLHRMYPETEAVAFHAAATRPALDARA